MAQKHTVDYKEYPMTRDGRIQGPSRRYRRLRHPSFNADLWTEKNPLLQRGEIGIEIDTYKAKVGDGVTYWNDLPYMAEGSNANIDLSNLSATGKANISAVGTYNESGTYSAGTVGKALQGKLNLDGSNTMTGVLKMRASISFQCAIAPCWDGVGFYKLNDNDSVTLMASMESTQGFTPFTTNTYDIGMSSKKWKNLYLAGKAFVGTINNGADITVPATSGTMALTSDIPTVPTDVSAFANDAGYITNTVNDLTNYTLSSSLATVATSGAYSDLSGTPTIPTVNDSTISITQNGVSVGSFTLNQASGDTIALTDTTYSVMTGASAGDAGASGLVPAPAAGDQDKVLKGDGTWGEASTYHPDLFDFKWADHQVNDVQWLRADTFSWQDGSVYEAAYNHLADDIDGKTLTSETVAGTTVQFYLADDGHKICPDSQESNVAAIYTATGVAWYYIIDTVNERFKLPRTQYGVTGYRDTVGNYVAPGLPNITGTVTGISDVAVSGAFQRGARVAGNGGGGGDICADTFDASRSSSIYGNSTTVQAPATQMYLYFYVGEFTQTALENTAGIRAEDLNNKVDVGHQVIDFQTPTAGNNYTWYRKYADGWVEQGGIVRVATTRSLNSTISLPITMSNNNYTISATAHSPARATYLSWAVMATVANPTTTTFDYQSYGFSSSDLTDGIDWQVSGMAA